MRTLTAVLVAMCLSLSARAADLTVFAAASMTDVMQRIAAAWDQDHNTPLRLSFAASSVLARQIEQGAPADVFISANRAWIEHLQRARRIAPSSRRTIARNSLVIIGDIDERGALPLNGILRGARHDRIALGDPDHVPVGIYARQALTHLGFWNSVRSRIVPTANTRATITFVQRRATRFGITYLTDALAFPDVRQLAAIPAHAHDPIIYEAAKTANGTEAADRFLDWLAGPEVAGLLASYGFQPCEAQC